MDQDQIDVAAARAKLAARFSDTAPQIGGKGKYARDQNPKLPITCFSMSANVLFWYSRHPEKKEEACYRAECQWGQEA